MNSFRLRLALLVGTCTAALLLGTGYFAWQLTQRFSLEHLDRELRNLAKPNLERLNDASHWSRFNEALALVSGGGSAPAYAVWVRNHGREEYRSPHWPAALRAATYADPTAYEGGLTFATPPAPPRRVGISASNPALPAKVPYFFTADADGSRWRVGVLGNPYTTLVLAANLDAHNADLRQMRRRFLAALPLALLLAGGGAWLLASRALRPVAILTEAAERITDRGLDQRIAAPAHHREFQRLISVFNAMLDRLEQGFHQARRFSADASHELKTPLALLQAELEQALRAAPSGSPEQQTYTSLLEEVQHLKAILEKLLLLSLADSGRLVLERTPLELSRIVADVAEDSEALAPELTREIAIAPAVTVRADAVLLEQALQNLTGNAIKYNRPAGRIHLALAVADGSAVITIGNTGAGIPAADQSRIFERFYRADPARRRDRTAGAGLGLSLSREILRAHGGDLRLSRAEPDWTEFTATVPLATEPVSAPGTA